MAPRSAAAAPRARTVPAVARVGLRIRLYLRRRARWRWVFVFCVRRHAKRAARQTLFVRPGARFKKKRRKISNQRESKNERKEIPNHRVGESKKERKEIPNQRVGESKKERKEIPNQRMGERKKEKKRKVIGKISKNGKRKIKIQQKNMEHHFKKRVSITTISIGMMAWQRGRQRRGEILGCGWWSEKGMVG